jgi:oligopeptide/dipeptide ABC transporter ATP-binding protein
VERLYEIDSMSIVMRRLPSRRRKTLTPPQGEERLVIEAASLTVHRDECVALVGESGAGKSLLAMGSLELLDDRADVTDGVTRFEGQVLQDLEPAEWRRIVGMGIGVLMQDAIGSWDPLDMMGVQSGEVLDEHTDLSDEEVKDRVLSALGEVGLPRRRHFRAFSHEVSRGQAQRAMLAATLLSGPRMLVADEPLSGLDATAARAILGLIDDMRTRRGMGMLFVTHDLGMVAAVADRVAVMYAGSIVEHGAIEAIYRRPQHPYTSGLLGSVPALVRGTLRPIDGEPPNLFDIVPGCRFAPRCPHAIERCRVERPALRPIGDSLVACHRAEELELEGIASRH